MKHNLPNAEPLRPIHEMPASIYASLLSRKTIESDITVMRGSHAVGPISWQTLDGIEQRHYHRNGDLGITAALRYINLLAELVEQFPKDTPLVLASRLKPMPDEERHWEPLTACLDIQRAHLFTWRREQNSIQSYRNEETRGYLRIDDKGQFYDRHSNVIDRAEAMNQAFDDQTVDTDQEPAE